MNAAYFTFANQKSNAIKSSEIQQNLHSLYDPGLMQA